MIQNRPSALFAECSCRWESHWISRTCAI